jgi:hypothetical protein
MAAHKYAEKDSMIAKAAKYINTPIIAQYIGYLPCQSSSFLRTCLLIESLRFRKWTMVELLRHWLCFPMVGTQEQAWLV